AAGEKSVPLERAPLRAQNQRSLFGAVVGSASAKERNLQTLSRPRLSRRRRIRRRRSGALLFRKISPRPQPRRSGNDRRTVQTANQILAAVQSAARARANVVLDNLVENGFMSEGQVYGARRNPATPIDRAIEDAPNYYLDWAFDEMRKLVDTLPKSVTSRSFTVRTALDGNLQHY